MNILMKKLSVVALMIVSSSVLANTKVSVVMKAKVYDGPVSSQNIACHSAPNGAGEWCLIANPNSEVSAQGVGATKYVAVDLDSYGYTAKEVAEMLTNDGRFGLVEPDVAVSSFTSTPIQIPATLSQNVTSDPALQYQNAYFAENSETMPVGMGVYKAWDEYGALNNSDDKLDVIILDGSFFENADMPYMDGRSFSRVAINSGDVDADGDPIMVRQDRNDDYLPRTDNEFYASCNGHGLGVAATVGATADNGIAGAGVTNNVNVHAIRTMTCGTGSLFDTSDALHWLAGSSPDKFMWENSGVTPYSGKAGVVNISLSAKSACTDYMQEAIDAARGAGFVIVAAAANYTEDASIYMPSNCEGVVSVAALNAGGDLASFSNFGPDVDYAAIGRSVVAPCSEGDDACWWDGTSFSSPAVAGVIASAMQVTGASNDEIEMALGMSSSAFKETSTCSTGICGKGVPSLDKLITVTSALMNGELNSVSHALSGEQTCEQTWLVENFGQSLPLCQLYRVSFLGGYTDDAMSYELYQVADGVDLNGGGATLIGTFSKGEALIENVNAEEFDYGFKVCTDGTCADEIMSLNETQATAESKPVACQ